ncbi:MAG TPA: cyclic nucleotide-binding domain-containing protein [Burkholderiaceae bacterium]|nr:cyclic nucleotide-binding domain-containing protein [Burkholderiaceae bacterium]HRP28177.1 cyclic nucleotide-binding domain-containing protein [Burkholderiaceae bacterium]
MAELVALTQAWIAETLASPWQILAVVASAIAIALVVVGSFVKTMIPLRWLAVGGNVGFVIYGALHPSIVMLVLNAALLPINIVRAVQMVRLTRRVRAATKHRDSTGIWLKPYMVRTKRKAGEILFRKGDKADHLYFLVDGKIALEEIGAFIEPGTMFGVIAFFAPDNRRTLTARCTTKCTVLTIDESTLKQLYYQNPEFGFELMAQVASGLTADKVRLEQELARRPEATPESVGPGA